MVAVADIAKAVSPNNGINFFRLDLVIALFLAASLLVLCMMYVLLVSQNSLS